MTLLRALLSALSTRDIIAGLLGCGLVVAVAVVAIRARMRRASWRRDQRAVETARQEREHARFSTRAADAQAELEHARARADESAARMNRETERRDKIAEALSATSPEARATVDAWLHPKEEK